VTNEAQIARVCHEANRAYCVALGDFSQLAWEDAPQWQRDSCIDGVRFRLANPDAPIAASHQNWYDHKLADGWKYGAVKDHEKKEHPCMVAFADLPEEQQRKDAIFASIVAALTYPIAEM